MHNRTFYKSFLFLGSLFLIFHYAPIVFAGNPVSPILPGDNIQDPGNPATAWGGCGPTDSNCYVTTTGSQWTTTGSNIYYNTGNVGIGTTTPTSLFQVNQPATGVGTVTTAGTTTLTGTGTQFTTTFKMGNTITVSGETVRTISAIASDTSLTVTVAFSTSSSGLSYTVNQNGRKFAVGNNQIFIGNITAGSAGDGGQGSSTAFGVQALNAATVGAFQNDAFGLFAQQHTTTGSDNTALGSFSLQFNTTGSNNVSIGRDSMENSVTGWYNTAIGVASLFDMGASSGNSNTAVGRSSGRGITTGAGNTIIGAWTTGLSAALTNTVLLSDGSNTGTAGWRLYSPVSGNILFGTITDAGAYKVQVAKTTTAQTAEARVLDIRNTGATFDTTAGNLSSYGGYFSSTSTESAGGNVLTNVGLYATASGADANYAAIFEAGNVGIGTATPQAQLEITGNFRLADQQTDTNASNGIIYKDGTPFIHNFRHPTGGGARPNGSNTFVGLSAGNLTMGSTATATYQASNNSGFGVQAFTSNTTGYYSSAFGYLALNSNTTGYSNSAFGMYALKLNDTGHSNSALGIYALERNTLGYYNAALGYFAGGVIADGSTSNQTSNTSVYLGASTKALADGDSNEIVIGYNTTGFGTNTAAYGNSSITKHIFQAGSVGIGDTTPDYLLDVENLGVDNYIFSLHDSDGECLHDPEAGAETVTCSSDERLKINITNASSALSYFNTFNIKEYDVIASGDHMTGVIAQQVLNIHPELVTTGSGGMYSVQLPNQWKMVKAIQELDLKINGIKTQQQICINDTCINEAQLKQIIQDTTNNSSLPGTSIEVPTLPITQSPSTVTTSE